MGNPVMTVFKLVVFIEYRSTRITEGTKPATLNRELQTFKAVFNDLIRSGQYDGKNHFSAIKQIRSSEPKTVFLSTDQIKKLFSYLEKSDSDAYLVALVCLATGARWGEAQGLTLRLSVSKPLPTTASEYDFTRRLIWSPSLNEKKRPAIRASWRTD